MNSLEFVEQATIANQRRLEQYKKDLEYYQKESGCLIDYGAKIFHLKNDIKHIEEIVLPNLQKFKVILEAWEICKNKLNLKVQTEEAVTEGFCMKGYWLFVEQYPYTQTTIIEQEEYEILKKALEVEDESK